MSSTPAPASMSPLFKLGLLSALTFSQGLPFGFFTQALPVVLRTDGYSLSEIGLASLLALPWALKFLWAPLVDRHYLPRVGRRATWIVPLQLAAVLALIGLAATGAHERLGVLLAVFFLLNLLSATQDIATDGLAVDVLSPRERGFANGIQVAGYRVGMIVGGGVMLILFERLGAANTFLIMAALVALASVPVLLVHEPHHSGMKAAGERGRDQAPAVHFVRRPGALRLLLVIASYKLGDAFATAMLRPFLADAGLSLSDIGWLLGTVGFMAGLLGALTGGALVNRLGRARSLLAFGALQAVAVSGYAYLAAASPSLLALYGICGFEHFVGGMATAALFTCMMDWSSPESAATDYTVQASAVVIATGVASTIAGYSAENLGYFAHFAIAAALAVASLVVVMQFFPRGSATAALHSEPRCEVQSCA